MGPPLGCRKGHSEPVSQAKEAFLVSDVNPLITEQREQSAAIAEHEGKKKIHVESGPEKRERREERQGIQCRTMGAAEAAATGSRQSHTTFCRLPWADRAAIILGFAIYSPSSTLHASLETISPTCPPLLSPSTSCSVDKRDLRQLQQPPQPA